MSSVIMHDAVRHLRRMALHQKAGSLSDALLLEGFIARRDEAAFEALVQRHGPMVLGVCRRLLRHEHDAEDAFQATFILLVRKAATLDRRELLGNWLYGVAYRTALEARSLSARRHARETPTGTLPEREAHEQEDWSQLRPILDEELNRLPVKYRIAVVLCDLEGKTRKEAARQLQLPEGTLNGRLTTAHRLLAQRLGRRGVTLSVAAMFISLRAARAVLPPGLMPTTIVAVRSFAAGNAAMTPLIAALTEGLVKSMLVSRLKMTAALLMILGLLLVGTSNVLQRAQADTKPDKKTDKPDKKPDTTDKKPDKKPNPTDKKVDKKPGAPTISGTATEVDNKKGIIAISVQKEGKGKETEEKTFILSKDVKVTLMDILTKEKPLPMGAIGDVTIGTPVSLQLTEDKKTVVAISARGPGMHGGIKEVDAEKGTITITYKDGSGAAEKTLTVEKGARILLSDGLKKDEAPKEAKLSDLKAGTQVHIQLTVDRKRALSVQPLGKSVQGTLKGIDKGNQTVTVEYKDNTLVEKSFTLSKSARVDENAAVGDRVNVRLSVFDDAIAVEVRSVEKKEKK